MTGQRRRRISQGRECQQAALILGLLAFWATVNAQDWEFEHPELLKRFGYMTDHSLALDDAGCPHIAYGGDHLYYVWYDMMDWKYETVDTSLDVGRHASLVLDDAGLPAISYYDAANGDLKCASKSKSGWRIETVDSDGDVGLYTSIALDAAGHAHISYYDATSNDLKYAHKTESGWVCDSVDHLGDVGQYSSLALDRHGFPHVGYFDSSEEDLKYAHFDGLVWSIETADSEGEVGMYVSIALDKEGCPHFSYQSYFSDVSLKYARKDQTGWLHEAIPGLGKWSTIRLDGEGCPHIASSTPFTLHYTHMTSSGWQSEVVEYSYMPDYEFFGYMSIALDSLCSPHISYSRGGRLKFAQRDESGWNFQTLDVNVGVGNYSSLTLDNRGFPSISYYDATNEDLKYVARNDTGWYVELVDAQWDVGRQSSLALDSGGNPNIAYYAFLEGELRYARKDLAGWHMEMVDWVYYSLGGRHISLAVDSNDCSHLAYFKGWSTNDLVYAFRGPLGWEIEVIDQSTSGYPSIALDEGQYPGVSYTNGILMYAWKDELGWHTESVGDETDCSYTSLDLTQSGSPHIAYCAYDLSNGTHLKYAFKDTSGWNIEIVDSNGHVGSYCSLALDQDEHPRISYSPDLKYAFKDESGWHVEIVDSIPVSWTSIALDEEDGVHISYYDESKHLLKYALQRRQSYIQLSATLESGALVLTWTPVGASAEYWIYGALNQSFFVPSLSPDYDYRLETLPQETLTWSSSNGIGDTNVNWTYLVMAVDETEVELARSNRVGEQDFESDIP